jgi:hypothetical protein
MNEREVREKGRDLKENKGVKKGRQKERKN